MSWSTLLITDAVLRPAHHRLYVKVGPVISIVVMDVYRHGDPKLEKVSSRNFGFRSLEMTTLFKTMTSGIIFIETMAFSCSLSYKEEVR